MPTWFLRTATTLGMLSLFRMGMSVTSFFWRHLMRPLFLPSNHVFKRYANGSKGENGSWAVVTGASDGIGLAMCKKLAREGFNICMVARNE